MGKTALITLITLFKRDKSSFLCGGLLCITPMTKMCVGVFFLKVFNDIWGMYVRPDRDCASHICNLWSLSATHILHRMYFTHVAQIPMSGVHG